MENIILYTRKIKKILHFPMNNLGLRDFFIIIEKSVAMQAPYSYTMKFFEELGVDLELSDMSFSVSLDNGKGYEWASRNGLAGLFAQRTNVLNPFFWQMLSEIRKFKQHVVEYARQILLYFQLIYFHVSIHAACSVLFLYSKCISFKFC